MPMQLPAQNHCKIPHLICPPHSALAHPSQLPAPAMPPKFPHPEKAPHKSTTSPHAPTPLKIPPLPSSPQRQQSWRPSPPIATRSTCPCSCCSCSSSPPPPATTAAAVSLCASAVLKRKCVDREGRAAEGRPPAGCASLKQALLGTVRWSSSRKLGEWDSGRWEGLDLPARAEGGWDSLVETAAAAAAGPSSPLWQQRRLIGERCELLRFSGLILYDERGFPLLADC
ncbi:hypothetical protein Taro_023494 [Colocasia esculenta]|uniref:Uncharacterized protein n=1 Tax=Colocasia esculenta TaxID=4460 RepID=A0A843VHH9_COLES|nr:hypothetical protein [Colocasia esculenta]